MEYSMSYDSPIGKIFITGDDSAVTGLWFEGQRFFPEYLPKSGDTAALRECKSWLDIYFSGKCPGHQPPVRLIGTDFQKDVWKLLCTVPYGKTASYGDIAAMLAKKSGRRMPAQAVGGAVGRNRIALIIPCHRIVGADGSLTGYAGGIDRKKFLLDLEKNSGK